MFVVTGVTTLRVWRSDGIEALPLRWRRFVVTGVTTLRICRRVRIQPVFPVPVPVGLQASVGAATG